MALAVFDVSFKGLLRSGATSEDRSVSESVVGIDTILTASAMELYGRLVEAEIDVRRNPGSDLFEVDYGFGINLGMARRAALSGNALLMNPQPMIVLDALGLRKHDLADPQQSDAEDGTLPGLFQLLIALGGREIDRVDLLGDVVDINCGRDVFHVSYTTYRLLRNRGVRRAISAFGDALKNTKLQRIVFTSRTTGEVIVELDSRHILSLAMPEEKDVLLIDEVRTMALSLAGPVAGVDDTWTFSTGSQMINIRMLDANFQALVDNGVFSLYPGDILIANVRIVARQTAEGLTSEYTILKVVDMRWPNRHTALPGV